MNIYIRSNEQMTCGHIRCNTFNRCERIIIEVLFRNEIDEKREKIFTDRSRFDRSLYIYMNDDGLSSFTIKRRFVYITSDIYSREIFKVVLFGRIEIEIDQLLDRK